MYSIQSVNDNEALKIKKSEINRFTVKQKFESEAFRYAYYIIKTNCETGKPLFLHLFTSHHYILPGGLFHIHHPLYNGLYIQHSKRNMVWL